jgi:hypothetical protein
MKNLSDGGGGVFLAVLIGPARVPGMVEGEALGASSLGAGLAEGVEFLVEVEGAEGGVGKVGAILEGIIVHADELVESGWLGPLVDLLAGAARKVLTILAAGGGGILLAELTLDVVDINLGLVVDLLGHVGEEERGAGKRIHTVWGKGDSLSADGTGLVLFSFF